MDKRLAGGWREKEERKIAELIKVRSLIENIEWAGKGGQGDGKRMGSDKTDTWRVVSRFLKKALGNQAGNAPRR